MTPKLDLPAIPCFAVLQSVDAAATDANAGETGARLITKRSIHELVAQVCFYLFFVLKYVHVATSSMYFERR